MARHATRFAGRRRRNNGRAGAARRGALSLSLCVSRGDREGERSGGVRSRSRRLETHSHACRALPPPPIGSSEAIRPVRLLPSLPPGPTHGPDVRREAAMSRPFLSIPQGQHRSSLCLSVSLSFHPRCCCCCRWWWWWWVLTPPSPTRRALPLTASPFPKRSAGSLQTTALLHSLTRRARATGEEGLALEEHVPGPRKPSWELAGAMFGVTRGRKRHRGSRRGRERGGALLCRRPPPRPASLFRVFQVQILNSSSKIQQVFRSKWARTERERERERGRILCPLHRTGRGEKGTALVSGGVPPEKLSPAGVEEGACSARRGSGGSEPRALYAGSGAWKCRT